MPAADDAVTTNTHETVEEFTYHSAIYVPNVELARGNLRTGIGVCISPISAVEAVNPSSQRNIRILWNVLGRWYNF
jgi:hypothetical protein